VTKVKIIKKELKDVITIVKRFIKDKENGRIFIQSDQDGTIKIQAFTKQIISLHVIEQLDDEDFAFLVNPYEMEPLLKGRDKELEFHVKEESLFLGESSISIQPHQKKTLVPFRNLSEFNDGAIFLDVLKEADSLLFDSMQACTSYLKMTPKKALATEPKRIHYYRIDELFGFREAYFHKDVVNVLTKVLKGPLKHGMFKNAFVLQDGDKHYYLLKIDEKVSFPVLRNMRPLELVSVFEVNAKNFNELAANYKKKVKEIAFSDKDGYMIIDPRNEEFEPGKLPIKSKEVNEKITKGNFGNVVFETSTIKGLFMGYDDTVNVEHYRFENSYGQEGYMWRITTTDKITMAAGITEPNWDALKISNQ
jgi:hypothetical protein